MQPLLQVEQGQHQTHRGLHSLSQLRGRRLVPLFLPHLLLRPEQTLLASGKHRPKSAERYTVPWLLLPVCRVGLPA